MNVVKNNQYIMAGTTTLPGISNDRIKDLLNWHDKNKTILENYGSVGLYNPWLHTKIRDNKDINNPTLVKGSIFGSLWNKEFVDLFPDLIDTFNQLPFKKIQKIVLLETVKECVVHIDSSSNLCEDKTFEPCGYRMFLRHPTNSKGFFVQAIPHNEFGCGPRKETFSPYQKQYYNPKVGKWWILNNWCCQHGSEWKEGDNKVLISIIGTPSEKHKEILNSLTDVLIHPNYQNLNYYD